MQRIMWVVILILLVRPSLAAVTFVTDASGFTGGDRIDWAQLGPVGTVIYAPLSVSTVGGLSVTLNTGGSPPSFQRVDEGNGFVGDYTLGTSLLATNSLGSTSLKFNGTTGPVYGVGAYVNHRTYPNYTAYMLVVAGGVSTEFTLPVTNHQLENGSAQFIGVISDSRNITEVYFDSYFGLNTVTSGPLLLVPEPGTAITASMALAATVLLRNRRLAHRRN